MGIFGKKKKNKNEDGAPETDLTQEFWGNDRPVSKGDVDFMEDVEVEEFLQETENDNNKDTDKAEKIIEDAPEADDLVDDDDLEDDLEDDDLEDEDLEDEDLEEYEDDDLEDDLEDDDLEDDDFEDEDLEEYEDDDLEDDLDEDDLDEDDDLDYDEDDFYDEEINEQSNKLDDADEVEEVAEDEIEEYEEENIAEDDSNSEQTQIFDLKEMEEHLSSEDEDEASEDQAEDEDLEDVAIEDLELPDWRKAPEETDQRFKEGSADWDDIDAAFAAVHEELEAEKIAEVEDEDDVEKAVASTMRVKRVSASIGDAEETTGLAADNSTNLVETAETLNDDLDEDLEDDFEDEADEIIEAEIAEYVENDDSDEDDFDDDSVLNLDDFDEVDFDDDAKDDFYDDALDELEEELEENDDLSDNLEVINQNETDDESDLDVEKISAEFEFDYDDEIEGLEEYENPATSENHKLVDENEESDQEVPQEITEEPKEEELETTPRTSRRKKSAFSLSIFASQEDTLNNRLVSAAALGILAIVAIALGAITTLAFICLILILLVFEFSEVLRKQGSQPATLVVAIGVVGLTVGAYTFGMLAYVVVLPLTIFAATAWYLFKVVNARPLIGLAMTFFTLIYIGVLGSFAGLQLSLENADGRSIGTAVLMLSVLCSVAYDVAAYFVGKALGETPLIVDVSPNKTLEGYLAGVIAAIIVGGLFGIFGPYPFQGNFFTGLIIGVVVAVLAPMGDLVESMIKRDLGVKDISTLLPGHGGLLDRFDGLLFVLPGVFFATVILVG